MPLLHLVPNHFWLTAALIVVAILLLSFVTVPKISSSTSNSTGKNATIITMSRSCSSSSSTGIY